MFHDHIREAAEILLSMHRQSVCTGMLGNIALIHPSVRAVVAFGQAKARCKGAYKTKGVKRKAKTKRKKCPHGRQEYYCRDCKGRGICKHGRQRTVCFDCHGNGICEHMKVRSRCKDCEGRLLRDRCS
jgi:hypothetical protein